MNQFPTTDKQLELYREFNLNRVKYALIGGLAARFHGRNRITKDVDLLIQKTMDNGKRVKDALCKLGYPAKPIALRDFLEYDYIRVGGKMLIDLHTSYFGVLYEDVNIEIFNYNDVNIHVADKPSLINILSTSGFHSEDIKILKLLNDPVDNADEINSIQ